MLLLVFLVHWSGLAVYLPCWPYEDQAEFFVLPVLPIQGVIIEHHNLPALVGMAMPHGHEGSAEDNAQDFDPAAFGPARLN